jgi:hypothetical protein
LYYYYYYYYFHFIGENYYLFVNSPYCGTESAGICCVNSAPKPLLELTLQTISLTYESSNVDRRLEFKLGSLQVLRRCERVSVLVSGLGFGFGFGVGFVVFGVFFSCFPFFVAVF